MNQFSKISGGLLFLLIAASKPSFSQTDTTQGVFPSSQHYTNDSILCLPNGKLKLNSLFNSDIIVLKNGNEKLKFNKDSIYGYCKENSCYRFYKDEEYKIEDTGSVYIYSQTTINRESKVPVTTITLYFSANADSPILPLNVHNVINTLLLSTEIAIEFLEKFDDKTILKHHPGQKKYDLNLFLDTKF